MPRPLCHSRCCPNTTRFLCHTHGRDQHQWQALQRGKNRKDTLAAVRSALINAWGLCLQALQGAPPETWCVAGLARPLLFFFCRLPAEPDLRASFGRDTYFEVLLTIMIRDELQISTLNSSTAQESWVSACCRLIWQTHEYVVGHLSGVITQEHLLLFCAKVRRMQREARGRTRAAGAGRGTALTRDFPPQVLAINYLQVPGLAQVIVRAVVRATPIVGRRSYKYVCVEWSG